MRVVYISNSAIPSRTANSIQVMKMCQALVQKGYDVELLAPQWRVQGDLDSVDLWRHYGVRPRFPIRRLPWPGRLGGHLYALAAVVYAFLSRTTVVYTRHLPAGAFASALQLPTICELHQLPGGRTSTRYLRCFGRGRGLRRLVAISHALKRDLIGTYSDWIDEDDVVVAHDGVDMERFVDLPDVSAARKRLGLLPNHFTAGYAGHLYPGKGIGLILNLARRCPQIDFLIMGGEPDTVATLRQELKQAGVANVALRGFIPNAELPVYLTACDVFLLPIQRVVAGSSGGNIARWTSPMKLFEYMACGRLIIASDLPVLREVLTEENALLCDPEDVDAWQRGLVRAAADVVWRQALGRRAQQDVQQYTWSRRVDACLETIQQRLTGQVA